jgi:hypothetical protein
VLGLEADSQVAYERFLRRVVASGTLWGLRSAEGWCVSSSNDEEQIDVMPFWSDEAYARQCARNDWSNFEPTAIPLHEFLAAWLPGMAREGDRVGTNWNAHLIGREVLPLDLKAALEEMMSGGA